MSAPARRKDVFANPNLSALEHQRAKRRMKGAAKRGIDAEGRFIGMNDVNRAWNFFWSSRRSIAPAYTRFD